MLLLQVQHLLVGWSVMDRQYQEPPIQSYILQSELHLVLVMVVPRLMCLIYEVSSLEDGHTEEVVLIQGEQLVVSKTNLFRAMLTLTNSATLIPLLDNQAERVLQKFGRKIELLAILVVQKPDLETLH